MSGEGGIGGFRGLPLGRNFFFLSRILARLDTLAQDSTSGWSQNFLLDKFFTSSRRT